MQKLFNFVGVPGLEPGLTEPKSVVLPLHHTPKSTPYIHIPGVRTTKIYQLCTKMVQLNVRYAMHISSESRQSQFYTLLG